jgi:hypothetical protein
MIRTPISVSHAPTGEAIVVCNDGTMWQLTGSAQWVEMPPIPQDESKDPLHKLYRENVDQTERLSVALHVIDDVRKLAEELHENSRGRPGLSQMSNRIFDKLGAFAHPSDELPGT